MCHGEEKNDPGMAVPPQPWPANPEMRFQVGFTYQLKIGTSDEAKTMKCLFDLSCIPASERDPELFWARRPGRKQVDLAKFKLFCEAHPRLVRRLREKLSGFERPEAIVQFLSDNKDLPTRIEDRTRLEPDQRLAEFPILPPQSERALSFYAYPNWTNSSLGSNVEDFDVYKCMGAWYTYAQVPLPPENPEPSVEDQQYDYDRVKHRLPKMSAIIFRGYPARAAAYFAEFLQGDGWFDNRGWVITDWFQPLQAQAGLSSDPTIGAGPKYDSGEAWKKAYEWYKRYAARNGLLIDPQLRKQLEREASRLGPGSAPHKKLNANEQNRNLTNFDSHDIKLGMRWMLAPEPVYAPPPVLSRRG